jgi:hypothetical protein
VTVEVVKDFLCVLEAASLNHYLVR